MPLNAHFIVHLTPESSVYEHVYFLNIGQRYNMGVNGKGNEMKVVLIGDSIRVGYQPLVASKCTVAEVCGPDDNCGIGWYCLDWIYPLNVTPAEFQKGISQYRNKNNCYCNKQYSSYHNLFIIYGLTQKYKNIHHMGDILYPFIKHRLFIS